MLLIECSAQCSCLQSRYLFRQRVVTINIVGIAALICAVHRYLRRTTDELHVGRDTDVRRRIVLLRVYYFCIDGQPDACHLPPFGTGCPQRPVSASAVAWRCITLSTYPGPLGVPRQFVYRHFVHDIRLQTFRLQTFRLLLYTSVQDSNIQLMFQQIIIFINSNFYLHYDSFL